MFKHLLIVGDTVEGLRDHIKLLRWKTNCCDFTLLQNINHCLFMPWICVSAALFSQLCFLQYVDCGLPFVYSDMQSGCCKPSNDCGFNYAGPTQWTKGNTSSTNPDCGAWGNDARTLCYNCQSCKAGLLDQLKSDWKKVAIVNIVFLIVLIIVYSIGCCAFRNSRRDNDYGKYPLGRWCSLDQIITSLSSSN